MADTTAGSGGAGARNPAAVTRAQALPWFDPDRAHTSNHHIGSGEALTADHADVDTAMLATHRDTAGRDRFVFPHETMVSWCAAV